MLKSLLLGCTSIVAGAASPWSVAPRADGSLDLSFRGEAVLSGGCPAIALYAGGAPVSFCSDTAVAPATAPPLTARRGVDPQLGNFTVSTIRYAAPVEATLELTAFDAPSVVLHVQLRLAKPLTTNYISPLATARWSLPPPGDSGGAPPRVLKIPIDNDVQSMYESVPAPDARCTSLFGSALYDAPSGRGLVLGFLQHDLWKSGVQWGAGVLSVLSGVNGLLLTRDDGVPHGAVPGVLAAPLLSLGLYDDWRDGMEQLAGMQRENGGRPVPLPAGLGYAPRPLAGWNSWAMAADHLGQPNATNMAAVVDVLAPLRARGFGPQQVVARDAVYGLDDSATRAWVARAEAAGERAGTYDCPVVWYASDHEPRFIDCGDNACNATGGDEAGAWVGGRCDALEEVLLKDGAGKRIQGLAARLERGTQCVRDVTHPNFACHLRHKADSVNQSLSRFNYSLFKLDFLNLAALEGEHRDKALAPTGMAAYSLLLRMLADAVGGRAVVDYGISLPLPVGPAGHARHAGCEQMYGGIEYGMNEYAGSWWLGGLYTWLDPDLVTLQGDFWFRPNNATRLLSMDGRSRVAKAVVYGGLFKSGDDLSNATNAALTAELMGNARVNAMWAVARAGVAATFFRPVGWGTGGGGPAAAALGVIWAPPVFARTNGDVAIFNYGPLPSSYTVDLAAEAGMPADKGAVACVDAWDGTAVALDQRSSTPSLALRIKGLHSMLISCRATTPK